MLKSMITKRMLDSRFEYKDGLLLFLPKKDDYPNYKTWNKRYSGQECASIDPAGFKRIQLSFYGETIKLKVHEVIFFMHYGYLPDSVVHLDGDKLNNLVTNLADLREVDMEAYIKKYGAGSLRPIDVKLKESIVSVLKRIGKNKYYDRFHVKFDKGNGVSLKNITRNSKPKYVPQPLEISDGDCFVGIYTKEIAETPTYFIDDVRHVYESEFRKPWKLDYSEICNELRTH